MVIKGSCPPSSTPDFEYDTSHHQRASSAPQRCPGATGPEIGGAMLSGARKSQIDPSDVMPRDVVVVVIVIAITNMIKALEAGEYLMFYWVLVNCGQG